MSNKAIEALSDQDLFIATEYAKFAYAIHCSVTKSQVMWKDLPEIEQSAWIHVIIGMRDRGQGPAPQHVTMNEESNASLRAILAPFAGKPMDDASMANAQSLLYAWVRERVQNELEEDEEFDDLCAVELVLDNGKLVPRFVGKPGRGEEILKRLFAV